MINAKLLIVDNDAVILKMYSHKLQQLSDQVYTAASGLEALEILEREEIDVLITDFYMPGMDGVELIARAIAMDPMIQCIVITGYGDIKNAIEVMGAGAFHYLQKPIDFAELEVTIVRCLEKRQLLQEVQNKQKQLEEHQKHLEELVATRTRALTETNQKLTQEIEERKGLEHALREAKALAEYASKDKSEFLTTMSYEIRTPMNGVIGMNRLLLDTELDETQQRYAEVVRSSGESLLVLINDILDFSRIEAGKLELGTLDFDLASLLDDFATTQAPRAQDKGVEFNCAADLDVPVLLQGDPGRLRQILTRLTGNALKFTQEGEVAIRVSLMEEQGDDVLLRFTVRDTGIGIPADKIGQFFNKSSQTNASTTRWYGGTGLGLAISKQLVELMGGKFGIESEEGQGSEIWFTVRLSKQAARGQAAHLPPADLRGVRVLIVDDNATSRDYLSIRLASWDMRPSVSEDGSGALQLLYKALDENDPFRLALIDMQMPGMDGKTLGWIIKAEPRLDGLRLVMLTSAGVRGDARRFAEIGFAAYVTKPIDLREMKEVLVLALSERNGATPAPIITRHLARETLKNRLAHRQGRILLVEDNIANQLVALSILQRLGLRADAVADGAAAVKALETIPYDLVLMDCQMPIMDGFQATACIRDPQSKCLNPAIPIIAITACVLAGDREKCLDAGMNGYVPKPISPHYLVEVLEQWLPAHADPLPEQRQVIPPAAVAAAAKESAVPVFDVVGMLARLMDNEKLAQKICLGYAEDLPKKIVQLQAYLTAGDIENAGCVANCISGAAANLGGEALRAVALAMEHARKVGDLDAARGHLPALKAQATRLTAAIQQYFKVAGGVA